MISLRTMAQVYRLGLLIGVFNKEDVIAWADHIIETSHVKDIPFSILDISLASKKTIGDIVLMIDEIQGNYELGQATKIILGELRRRYKNEPSSAGEVMSMLYALANESHELDETTYSDIMMVTDAYDLAVDRIVSMQETLVLIDNFFSPYQEYENVLHNS